VPSGISLEKNEREGAEKWPSHVRNFRSKIRKSTGIRTNFRKKTFRKLRGQNTSVDGTREGDAGNL
jgi:hypothetical protein